MRACVDLIDRQRRGEKVPGETVLSALWEEEVGNEEESHRSERRKGGKERVLAAV
jgi:hypothetical protein